MISAAITESNSAPISNGGDATVDAANWVASQADGEGKVDATGEVVGQWMRSDPEAASEWLGAQPVGDARDRGVAALLRDRSVREDPSTSVAWADTTQESERLGSLIA